MEFDFVFLCETFASVFPNHLFPSFSTFQSPGVKLSDAPTARLSGGVCLLVSNKLMSFVEQITVEYDNCIVLKISKHLTKFNTDCLLVAMYLPPSDSKYYTETEIEHGLILLDFCLSELCEQFGDLPMIICGDLNARTSHKNSRCSPFPGDDDDFFDNEEEIPRSSKDSVLNDCGRCLLNVCEQYDLSIMNGLSTLDSSDSFTYVSSTGASVIDYFIMSNNITCNCMCLHVEHRYDSKHMPVKMKLKIGSSLPDPNISQKYVITKYLWNIDLANQYRAAYASLTLMSEMKEAFDLIDTDINAAVNKFNEITRTAASLMEKKVCIKNERLSKWFDQECFERRRVLKKCLRQYHNCQFELRSKELRIEYTEKRRLYKSMLGEKKREFKQKTIDTLKSSQKDPSKFWSTVKSVTVKRFSPNCITSDEWLNHFKHVFGYDTNDTGDSQPDIFISNEGRNVMNLEILECDITTTEVENALKALKCGKAAGPDGFISELYKYAPPSVVGFLTKYFNKLFDQGSFPDIWTESVIQPIYKKGDNGLPDNYRGISLLNIGSKLYSYILNKRLTEWAEQNRVINETQAGFRQSYSTIDHIFTLLAVVQKQLRNHGKLYAAFIDFRKAFDLVDRNCLWNILKKHGISGRMYRAITSMYTVVKSKVRVGGELTETFLCPRGLKQGDVCSPILFSFLINVLADDISQNGRHGISLTPDLLQLFIMLFADDVVLFSYSVVGLQHQLNILRDNAKKLNLFVNMDKSKVVIFRNGGYIASKEKWFYDGIKLEIVNQYKYLGVIFSTGLTFVHTLDDMAKRAKKAVFIILKTLWFLEDCSPSLFFKLFDSQILPILTYGSEVWGVMTNHNSIEAVHLYGIKRLLSVSAKTPNALIYAETGRYPLYINTYVKSIRYWFTILSMSEERLPAKAYKMLLNIHHKNKITWASSVCNILYSYGFGYVWENQGAGDRRLFLKIFKQRLIDCHLQGWESDMRHKTRYEFYYSFKQNCHLSTAVFEIKNMVVRKMLIRFRMGVSPLRTHRNRFSKTNPQLQHCPFCENTFETEKHFLLICFKYRNLRLQFIPIKFFRRPSAFKVALLMASSHWTLSVALFIYKALKLRNEILSQH
jgi:hypothetical protein